MPNARRFVLVILGAVLAAAALAAEPQPATPPPAPATQTGPAATPAAPDPQAAVVDIPENQAEIEALRNGELNLEMPAPVEPTIDAARAARRAAIDAVLAEQDARVQALADGLAGASAEESAALQKEIEREKLATGRRLLELQLQFAVADGDQERVARLETALAGWDAPPPAGTPVERPAPDNPNR